MTKSAVIAVILVLISASFFCYAFINIGPDASSSDNLIIKKTNKTQITGNIDDAVNSFLQAADEEQAILGTGEEEKTLINSDNQDISGFSQSADQYEF